MVYVLVFLQKRYKNQENVTLPMKRVVEICSSGQFLEETACKLLSLQVLFQKHWLGNLYFQYQSTYIGT